MSSRDLERVESDLATIRSALALDLFWSRIDVLFCAAIAVSAGLYGLLSWPNTPLEIRSLWAAAPLFITLATYVGYMAVKARSLPPREEPRRREYRSTLVALAVVVPAAIVYLAWGTRAGMTGIQLRGSILALMGIAFLVVGITQPTVRYPRSYFIVGSLPLIAFGIALPVAPQPYHHSLIGLLGLVELGLAALIIARQIRRQMRLCEGMEHGAD